MGAVLVAQEAAACVRRTCHCCRRQLSMPDGGTVALDYQDYAADLRRQAVLDQVR